MRIIKSEIISLLFSITLTFLSIGVPFVLIVFDICIYKILNRGYEFFYNNSTRLPKPNIYSLKVKNFNFF